MQEARRRLIGYGAGGVVAAALVWVGFLRPAEADLVTLMGAADVHMRLAAGMPTHDRAGQPVAARTELLNQAEQFLDRAAATYPGHAQGHEYRAYLHYLRGEYAAAAASYEAAAAEAASGTARDDLVLNQARMLAQSGQTATALAVLERHAPHCGEERRTALTAELATIRAASSAARSDANVRETRAAGDAAGGTAMPPAAIR